MFTPLFVHLRFNACFLPADDSDRDCTEIFKRPRPLTRIHDVNNDILVQLCNNYAHLKIAR